MKRYIAKNGRCPQSRKVRYRDELSARTAMHAMQRHDDLEKYPQRVYECDDCGGWHLTSTDEIAGAFAERARAMEEK